MNRHQNSNENFNTAILIVFTLHHGHILKILMPVTELVFFRGGNFLSCKKIVSIHEIACVDEIKVCLDLMFSRLS